MSAISRRHLIAGAVSIALSSTAAFAAGQEDQNRQGQPQAQQQQGQQGGASGAHITVQERKPQIQVEQPQPKVTVQQPQPNVTVQQPQPHVTVQQPQPKVQVTTPQPEVSVQQAQPQVDVQRQGQPQVQVQRQGQPQVQVQQIPGQQAQQQGQQQIQAQPQQSTAQAVTPAAGTIFADRQLASEKVQNIEDMDVVNQNGDKLGEVTKVAVEPNTNRVFAIVSVGGFLGVGNKLIPMELNQMRVKNNDTLIAPVSMSADQLKQHQAYNSANYRELNGNQTLAAAIGSAGPAAATPGAPTTATTDFAEIDTNHDGVIEPSEAQAHPILMDHWKTADKNSDGHIDRSEFSAFEQSVGGQGGGQGGGQR